MKYSIFADVHSNLEAFEAVIRDSRDEGVDKFFCAGDAVGYAANPSECLALLRQVASAAIAGNHDWAAANLFSLDYFEPNAKESLLWTARVIKDADKDFLAGLKLVYKNEDLTLVHGTLDSPRNFDYMKDGYVAWESFSVMQTKVCFLGHTHTPGIFTRGSDDAVTYQQVNQATLQDGQSYIVNVGSVGQPRDGNPYACYCIYDTAKKEVRLKRISYDIEAVRARIILSGLPKGLGDRLIIGR